MNPNTKSETPLILWMALVGSVLIYGGATFLFMEGQEPVPGVDHLGMPIILIVDDEPSTEGKEVFLLVSSAFALLAAGLTKVVPRMVPNPFHGQIFSWALCESIAIAGIVVAVVGFPIETWGLFHGASLVLLWIYRPKKTGSLDSTSP